MPNNVPFPHHCHVVRQRYAVGCIRLVLLCAHIPDVRPPSVLVAQRDGVVDIRGSVTPASLRSVESRHPARSSVNPPHGLIFFACAAAADRTDKPPHAPVADAESMPVLPPRSAGHSIEVAHDQAAAALVDPRLRFVDLRHQPCFRARAEPVQCSDRV